MSKTSALFLLLGVLWRPAQALCPRGPRDATALWTDPSYDPSLPPERGSTDPRVPTSVNLTVLPIAIGKIDTAADAVTLRTTTVKVWRDPQLAFNASCADKILRHPYLSQHYLPSVVGSPVGLIWTPHTIVGNLVPEGEHEGFSSAFEKFDMASDGTVSWEHQADNHIKCTMDFREMPYDVQHCYMRVLSIRSTDDVRFEVPPADVEDVLYKDPDRLAQMSNAEWDCTAISEVRGFSASEASGDRFSYVDLNFTLRRKPGWYTSNVVLPTIVLIVISWSSFFISRAAVPARVALGIICYLTLNNLAGSVAQQMPKIDGPVRLTALLDTSKFFVLYSVLEYAMANWLMRIQKRVKQAVDAMEKERSSASSSAKVLGEVEVELVEAGQVANEKKAVPGVPGVPPPMNVRTKLTGVDKVLTRCDGSMYFTDHHLDIVSRYGYLAAYFIVVLVFLFQ